MSFKILMSEEEKLRNLERQCEELHQLLEDEKRIRASVIHASNSLSFEAVSFSEDALTPRSMLWDVLLEMGGHAFDQNYLLNLESVHDFEMILKSFSFPPNERMALIDRWEYLRVQVSNKMQGRVSHNQPFRVTPLFSGPQLRSHFRPLRQLSASSANPNELSPATHGPISSRRHLEVLRSPRSCNPNQICEAAPHDSVPSRRIDHSIVPQTGVFQHKTKRIIEANSPRSYPCERRRFILENPGASPERNTSKRYFGEIQIRQPRDSRKRFLGHEPSKNVL